MARQLVLWGPPTVSTEPGEAITDTEIQAWVRRCADIGVTKMISAGMKAVTVAFARKEGIEAIPYINFTAFPTYGFRGQTQGWSTDYLRVSPDSPQARKILDEHRPIWGAVSAGAEVLDPFAKHHPEFWSLNRDKRMELEPGEKRCLSLAFPEVRAKQIERFTDSLQETKSNGIQIEFVIGNEDQDSVSTYGYENAVADSFANAYGKSPFDIPNNHLEWMQFRADYVTRFMAELKTAITAEDPDAQFSATIIAGDRDDYIKVLQDWPAWIEKGIIDELYVWWRTSSDIGLVEQQSRSVADIVKGRIPFIAELSCYHPGSFQRAEHLIDGARAARANGADAVGLYRSHAIEQLGLWGALERMGKL